MSDDNQKYLSKTICCKNVNKNKFEIIKNYVNDILIEKNNVSKNVTLADRHLINSKAIKKFNFSKKYSTLEKINKNCPSTDLQSCREDVFVKYFNRSFEYNSIITNKSKRRKKIEEKKQLTKKDTFKTKNIDSDSTLAGLISFLCKQIEYIRLQNEVTDIYLANELYDIEMLTKNIYNFIFSKNTKTYVKWKLIITKFGYDRILDLCIKKYINNLKKNIVFRKLTIQHKNVINSNLKQLDLNCLNKSNRNKNKKFDSVININIPKIKEPIALVFKYNKDYHLNDFTTSFTNKTKDFEKYSSGYKQIQMIFKINVDTTRRQINIYYSVKDNSNLLMFNETNYQNYIGIDVNVKNNLFMLSDGKEFKIPDTLLKKGLRLDTQRSKLQQRKAKNKNEFKYGRKMKLKLDKNTRRSEHYQNLIVGELIKYCKSKNYNHIVMEDLNLKGNKKPFKNKDGINYNRLISLFHLNNLKNVIKRLANKNNIMVSFVNPKYTSQQCPICGHISKENRKNQENFVCEKCSFSRNADFNASCNIKDRVAISNFRNFLMTYDSEFNGYKGKKYIKKQDYIDLVVYERRSKNREIEWYEI